MRLFTLEHSAIGYGADFAVNGGTVVLLTAFLVGATPRQQRLEISIFVIVGLLAWSLIEYVVHRFVFHGIQPFCHWHARHHQRPAALIFAPTLLTTTVMATLVFLPVLLLTDLWRACALTLGVSIGYLAYTITHHATHHWRARGAWLKRRRLWHALHHRPVDHPGRYGVTTAFWDYIFRTTGARRIEQPQRQDRPHTGT